MSMIRALRVLDSSDLLLNFIAAPVREYLTQRKDTVRCVVSALTKNKDSELHGKRVVIIIGSGVEDCRHCFFLFYLTKCVQFDVIKLAYLHGWNR